MCAIRSSPALRCLPGDTECNEAVQSNGLSPFSRLPRDASSRSINIHPPPTSENSFATRAYHRQSLIMTGRRCTSRGIALRATGLRIRDNAQSGTRRVRDSGRQKTGTAGFSEKIRLGLRRRLQRRPASVFQDFETPFRKLASISFAAVIIRRADGSLASLTFHGRYRVSVRCVHVWMCTRRENVSESTLGASVTSGNANFHSSALIPKMY